MYNWKDTRNYRRFRDENGNVIANIIYVDGEEVAVSDEVYEAYFLFLRRDYLVFRAAFPVIQRLKCLKNRTKIFIVAEIRNCTLRFLFRV